MGTEIIAMFVATLMVGLLGHEALAAQQAAAAYLYILTSILIAGSQAAAANIRLEIWRKSAGRAKYLGDSAIKIWTAFTIVAAIIFFAIPEVLLAPFLDATDPTSQTILILAATLMRIHAVGIVFDAIRNISTGALRALGDVKTPMYIGFISTCGIALSLGYILGITYSWGTTGVYIARDVGLAIGAVVSLYRWLSQVKKKETEIQHIHQDYTTLVKVSN